MPTLLAVGPLKGLQFFFVELSKSTLKQHFSFVSNVKEDGHRELPVPAIMVCAGLSAAVASTVCGKVKRNKNTLKSLTAGMLEIPMIFDELI